MRVFVCKFVYVTVSTQKVWKKPLTIIASQPHSLLPLKMYGGGGGLVGGGGGDNGDSGDASSDDGEDYTMCA